MKFIAIAALSISATAFFCMQTAHASGQSAPVQASAPLAGAVPAGEGVLRFWGLEIYHARLWVPPAFDAQDWAAHPLALELTYRRGFDAAAIARRSLEEMRRQGPLDEALAQRWEQQLRAALPQVQPGDRVVGLYRPGAGVQFLHNGKPHGSVADAAFGARFMGIWLAPQTSEPALREALLALPR